MSGTTYRFCPRRCAPTRPLHRGWFSCLALIWLVSGRGPYVFMFFQEGSAHTGWGVWWRALRTSLDRRLGGLCEGRRPLEVHPEVCLGCFPGKPFAGDASNWTLKPLTFCHRFRGHCLVVIFAIHRCSKNGCYVGRRRVRRPPNIAQYLVVLQWFVPAEMAGIWLCILVFYGITAVPAEPREVCAGSHQMSFSRRGTGLGALFPQGMAFCAQLCSISSRSTPLQ